MCCFKKGVCLSALAWKRKYFYSNETEIVIIELGYFTPADVTCCKTFPARWTNWLEHIHEFNTKHLFELRNQHHERMLHFGQYFIRKGNQVKIGFKFWLNRHDFSPNYVIFCEIYYKRYLKNGCLGSETRSSCSVPYHCISCKHTVSVAVTTLIRFRAYFGFSAMIT